MTCKELNAILETKTSNKALKLLKEVYTLDGKKNDKVEEIENTIMNCYNSVSDKDNFYLNFNRLLSLLNGDKNGEKFANLSLILSALAFINNDFSLCFYIEKFEKKAKNGKELFFRIKNYSTCNEKFVKVTNVTSEQKFLAHVESVKKSYKNVMKNYKMYEKECNKDFLLYTKTLKEKKETEKQLKKAKKSKKASKNIKLVK